MPIVAIVVITIAVLAGANRWRLGAPRKRGALLLGLSLPAVVCLWAGPASAAVVAVVPTATAANYSVLGGSTVTNTGATTLAASLGLSPGTSITGFPPGQVLAPGTTDKTNAAAAQAQSDLTAAYINAAGRSIDATVTANLANLKLVAGVYAAPGKGALTLSGPLTLDGAGDSSSVFVIQTDSTLITGSGSTVTLINGALECNVFWQVGSSATLGTNSVFTGTILALTSITVTTGVTVHGRALARNGAVTLDTDTFTRPLCTAQVAAPTTTTSSTSTTSTTSTTAPRATTTTAVAPTTTTNPLTGGAAGPSGPTTTPVAGSPTPTSSGPELPRTGWPLDTTGMLATLAITAGAGIIYAGREKPLPKR